MPRPGRPTILRGLILGIAGAGAALWAAAAHRQARFAYTGTPVAGRHIIPLSLPDDEGARFDLARHRGQVVLVYFGYTHCPDVCPTTLSVIADAMRDLGPEARRVLPVFVTLDQARDTASALRAYLANFDPAPLGLTADPAATAAAAKDWGVVWRFVDGGAYIDHTSVITVVGPDGRVRLRCRRRSAAPGSPCFMRALALFSNHLSAAPRDPASCRLSGRRSSLHAPGSSARFPKIIDPNHLECQAMYLDNQDDGPISGSLKRVQAKALTKCPTISGQTRQLPPRHQA
jgi:protein SCO1